MNQATLDVVIQVQKIAQATKEIRGLDSTLSQAASAADASAKQIDQAGSVGGNGFAGGVSKGAQAAAGDLSKAGGAATATASEMGVAGARGGKDFASGVGAVKAAGVDLDAVAAGARATAAKMGVAGVEGGRGFAQGAGRGLAGTAGDLSKVSTEARSTAGQVGIAGDQAGEGFARGVRVAVQRVQGAFGSAVTAAKGAASDFGTAGRQAGDAFSDKAEAGVDGLKGKLKAGAALAGAAAGAALAAGMTGALSLDAANDKLAAQLGLTGTRSKMAGKIAGDLYAGAWGSSMEEVNTAVGAVMSSIKGMSGASAGQIEAMTARALDFATAFDIDVQKGVYHAGLAMKQGLAPNAKRAFDLIVAMSQRVPAELREDALEAQEEYGGFFASMGYSGKEAFGLLVGAAKEGRYALDKTGDAMKEFVNLSTDMSTGTKDAYKLIGLDAQTMAERILKGGKSAKGALRDTVDGLLAIKNPAKQGEAALALFGTPLEDLDKTKIPAFLRTLRGGGKAMEGFAGASKRMGDELNDNEKTQLTAFKRAIEVGIQRAVLAAIPVLSRMGDAVKGIAGPIAAVVGWFAKHKTAAVALGVALAPVAVALTAFAAAAVASKVAAMALAIQLAVVKGAIIAFSVASKAAAVAQWLLNAALLANPIGLIILAIVALAAAFILAWKKSETFRNIVIGVWEAIKSAISAAVSVIKGVLEFYFNTYKAIIVGAWNAIGAVTSAIWNRLKAALNTVWGAIKAAANTYWQGVKTVIVNPVRSVFEWVRTAVGNVRDWLAGAWATIRERASSAWQNVKEAIVNPLRSAWEWVRTAVGNVREWLSGAWSTIRERASAAWQNVKEAVIGPLRSAFEWVREAASNVAGRLAEVWGNIRSRAGEAWASIKSTIVDAFNGALRGVGRIVNAIIDVVNKLPGVSIGKVDWGGLAKGGRVSRAGVDHAQALAAGGKVTRPMAIVGEQAPAHPEYVVPTNPAYRGRALGLFGKLGQELGVPGYAVGGVLGDVGRAVTAPGRAALGLAGKGAGWFIDQLPSPSDYLPKWLVGLGSHAIDEVTGWIKDKVASLIPTGGGDGLLSRIGRGGTNAKAWALAKAFGLTVTSGYRDPQHNAAVGGVAGSSHTKGSYANPGAHDFVPADASAMRAAMAMGASWVDMHDFGSGLHLHVSWFAKGGVLDKMGGPAVSKPVAPFVGSYKTGGTLPRDGLYYGHRGETVAPKGAPVREGPLIVQNIENYNVLDDHDEERNANVTAHKLRATGVI